MSYLITTITIRTAKRASVIGDITVDAYNQRTEVKGQQIIKVKTHKTSGTYGSSVVPINAALGEWLQVYVNKIRPYITPQRNSAKYLLLKI